MNIARGLWRVWLVAALVWIGIVGGLNITTLREDAALVRTSLEARLQDGGPPTLDTPFGRFTPSAEVADLLASLQRLGEAEAHRRLAERQALAEARLAGTLALVLGPPLALGLLLFGVGWAVRGFRG